MKLKSQNFTFENNPFTVGFNDWDGGRYVLVSWGAYGLDKDHYFTRQYRKVLSDKQGRLYVNVPLISAITYRKKQTRIYLMPLPFQRSSCCINF